MAFHCNINTTIKAFLMFAYGKFLTRHRILKRLIHNWLIAVEVGKFYFKWMNRRLGSGKNLQMNNLKLMRFLKCYKLYSIAHHSLIMQVLFGRPSPNPYLHTNNSYLLVRWNNTRYHMWFINHWWLVIFSQWLGHL